MLHEALLSPRSMCVVGASDDTAKPGGAIVRNLILGGYAEPIYPVNPKSATIQGRQAYPSLAALPPSDLAIVAIPAAAATDAVAELAGRGTRGFIVVSAGFSEESAAGAELEARLRDTVNAVGGSLIGPNCVGAITPAYAGVFTSPVPPLDPLGCDLVSGSGATAVFIMESAIQRGLTFAHLFSVGNGAQTGVEEVLEHLDETWAPDVSAPTKLLYLETIANPAKLLKHARSLIGKGARIAAIKAGASEAGSRAASSHTGAMAGSDRAVDALFRAAGIVRCRGREELVAVATVMARTRPRGRGVAIVTHAGGPAVMLTDTLSAGGLEVPPVPAAAGERLKQELFPGSSVANPIDILATGTAAQLERTLTTCDREMDAADAIAVIFGSPGLGPVDAAYDVLAGAHRSLAKPLYPVFPSVMNAAAEMERFRARGISFFTDEVTMGSALARVVTAAAPARVAQRPSRFDEPAIARIVAEAVPDRESGYLAPDAAAALLDAAGIPRVQEALVPLDSGAARAVTTAEAIGYPVVMKVVGPIHKSDAGGVFLGIENADGAQEAFGGLAAIAGAVAVSIQPMLTGVELIAGIIREPGYGPLVLFGIGGIFVEALGDTVLLPAPVHPQDVSDALRELRAYPILAGARGRVPIDLEAFADAVARLSWLAQLAPRIAEVDLNPLLGNAESITAVDWRIRLDPQDGSEAGASR